MGTKTTNQETQIEVLAETLHSLISHYEEYHSSLNETIHMDALYKIRIELYTAFPQFD